MTSRPRPPVLATEIPKWLSTFPFTRFVTLAFNETNYALPHGRAQNSPYEFVLNRLKRFDAMMNHKILGSRWARRHDERMFAFYAPEKLEANPHWHGLVRFYPGQAETIADHEKTFDTWADHVWKKLVPAGTAEVQVVYDLEGVASYIAKSLRYGIEYDHFVEPDAFWRR